MRSDSTLNELNALFRGALWPCREFLIHFLMVITNKFVIMDEIFTREAAGPGLWF